VVKRRNNSSGIHHLQIDNKVTQDPKLIEDYILDFYKNLYAESISNVMDTSNMLGTLFIATSLDLCS